MGAPDEPTVLRPKYALGTRELVGDGEDADEDVLETWLIPGLVARQAPQILAGVPKSIKTWLALAMSIALASGKDLLGRAVRRSRVLVIEREDSQREIKRRIWLLSRGMGLDPRDLEGWLVFGISDPFFFDDEVHVAALKESIQAHEIDLVVIDSLARVHRGDENDTRGMSALTAAWSALSTETGAAILLVHHMAKAAPQSGPGHLRVRGSGDLVAAARHLILIDRGPNEQSQVSTDGNLADRADPFACELQDDEGEEGKSVWPAWDFWTGDS